MTLPAVGWMNKGGTSVRSCSCGSWAQHWINYSSRSWPSTCSVQGCSNKPSLGAHIINPNVMGEKIAPMCDSCNKLMGRFNLKGEIVLPSANVLETCGK